MPEVNPPRHRGGVARPASEARRASSASESASSRVVEPERLGRFVLRAKLGEGAFGAVFRALDPLLDREVALKIPHPGALVGEANKARYLREPKAAAQLRHPHIVPVFDAAIQGETLYVASALIDGKTLQERLVRGPLPAAEAAKLVVKLADALDYAHGRGIIHRDVKPANIMIDAEGEPLLMDFGLARIQDAADQLTHDGTIMGTPAYMAPEQARGDQAQVGPASDQYSLGVLLYELLSGKRPFEGKPSVVLSLLQTREPPPLAAQGANVPQDLETIVMKAMAKEPAARYATCRELAEDLRRWLDDLPIRARPLSAWEKGLRWTRRNPVISRLIAAVGVVLIAGFSTTFWQWREAEAGRRSALAAEYEAHRQAVLARENEKTAQENAQAANREKRTAEVARRQTELALDQARGNLYVVHVNWVQSAWKDGLGTLCNDLLDQYASQPELHDPRGFEWYYLKRICRKPLLDFAVFGAASSIDFSPDGRWIATANLTRNVALWDADTGAHRRNLEGHGDQIVQVAFSPDGSRLASASRDGTARLWRADSGELLHTLGDGKLPVESLAFSPDGSQLATATARNVMLWETTTGEKLREIAGVGGEIAFHPNGRHLLVAALNGVQIRDLETGEEVRRCTVRSGKPGAMAIQPNGLAIAAGEFGQVALFDFITGERIGTMNTPGGTVTRLTYSRDGRRLAAAMRNGPLRIWNVDTQSEEFQFPFEFGGSSSAAMNRDGTRIAGAAQSIVRTWNVPAEPGQYLLTPPATGLAPLNPPQNRASVAFSPDGNLMASALLSGDIVVREVATRAVVKTLCGHSAEVQWVTFSPDGELLASASTDQTVRIWNVKSGETVRTCMGHEGPVTCVAFNIAATQLVSGGNDRTVRVWDVASGKPVQVLRGCANGVFHVSFSPEGERVTSCDHTRVRVWDVGTGEERLNFEGGVLNYCAAVFTPDGRRLAVADRLNVRLCDPHSGQTLQTLSGHTGYVKSLAFTHDGTRLVSAGMDGSVRVWNPQLGTILLTLLPAPMATGLASLPSNTNSPLESVAVSPNGQWIAAAGANGSLRLWNGTPESTDIGMR